MTDLKLDRLRFRSPDTDLTVGLNPGAAWLGGAATTPDNRMFLPNLPTEEVFTTPDYRRTEGHVRLTRPVKVLGELVHGVVLEFRHGKVVSFQAEKGAGSLEAYLATDGGASFLGEVALVDSHSPIYQSGLLFYNILLDENAACHIALGAGLPTLLAQAQDLVDDDAKKAAGCNASLVHTDVMIGSPETEVIGIGAHGEKIPIIHEGAFAI